VVLPARGDTPSDNKKARGGGGGRAPPLFYYFMPFKDKYLLVSVFNVPVW